MWTTEERFDTADDAIRIEFRARSGGGPFDERLVPESAVLTIGEGTSSLESVTGEDARRIERCWETGEALYLDILREDGDHLHGRLLPVSGSEREFTVEWSKSTFLSKLEELPQPSDD
jgi:hypothetical protein